MADCLNNEEQITSNLDNTNQDNLSSELGSGNAITSEINIASELTSNTSSGEVVESSLMGEEQLASQLDLPVTHTYRGAETDNIVVSVDNNSYTISASLKQIKFKTVADFPVVGSDRLLYIDATENSLYSWDSDLGQYRKLTADVGDVENYDDTELRGMIADLNNNKADKTEIPDVSQFITKTVSGLENYYRKSETYTQAEIDAKISAIPKFSIQVVASLPTENISETTVYLVASGSESKNLYTEYIYVNGVWEKLGEQKLDLSGYPTIEEMNTAIANALAVYYTKTETDTLLDKKVDKVEGKGLSTNDLTDDLLGKINNNTVIEITESSVHIKDLSSGVYKLAKDTKISFYSSKTITVGTEAYLFVTQTNDKRNEFYLIYSDYSGESAGATKYLVTGYCNWGTAFGYSNTLVLNKEYIDKESAQTIAGEITFSKAPKNTDTLSDSLDDETIVTAKWTNDKLDAKQDKLDAGTGITIEGNRISASLGDGAQIIKLSSPVHIYNLDSGVYQLPAGCELYYNNSYASGEEHYYRINYVNESEAILFVQTTEYYANQKRDRKMFVLFAESDDYTRRGDGGSYIVGTATKTGGKYHIAGIDTSIYIPLEDDGWIGGNKSFLNPVKYYKQYESLDTSLNDRTFVDAQWVKAQGYLNESELAGKGYLTSIPSEYVTQSELEQQGFAKQTEVNRLDILLATKLDDFEVLIGTNPPSTTTVGAVGQLYYASDYDSVYMCVGTLSGGTYNWKPVGGALYLPTSGGTVTGNLTVNQTLTVGNANIAYNSTDKCLKFTFN